MSVAESVYRIAWDAFERGEIDDSFCYRPVEDASEFLDAMTKGEVRLLVHVGKILTFPAYPGPIPENVRIKEAKPICEIAYAAYIVEFPATVDEEMIRMVVGKIFYDDIEAGRITPDKPLVELYADAPFISARRAEEAIRQAISGFTPRSLEIEAIERGEDR